MSRPLQHQLLETSSLIVFVGLQALLLQQFWGASHSLLTFSIISGASLLMGWLSADLFSGIVHYAADNWGSETTPILGKAAIAPFREHHSAPKAMLEHGFLERNGNSALVTLPMLALAFLLPTDSAWTLFLKGTCMVTGGFIVITNQIHAWAHEEAPPMLIRRLQKWGVFLSKEHHDGHHSVFEADGTPRSRAGNYCITSGACDRFLNRITQ